MKMKLTILLLVFSSSAMARNDPYVFCSIAGFMQQDSSTFISSIAITAAKEKGVFMNQVCHAVFKEAQEIHNKLTSGQRLSENEQTAINQALEFKDKVNKQILRNIGY